LHAFNGWADRFLATPKEGLNDMYVSLTTTFVGAQFILSFHDYEANAKSTTAGATFGKVVDYGSELNFSVSKKVGAVTYLAKYASFNNGDWVQAVGAKSLVSDTQKIWLQTDWSF
jgi:hypothetical protein